MLFLPTLAFANPKASPGQAIDFSSDDGLAWNMEAKTITMAGNAQAQTEIYAMRADKMVATYLDDRRISKIDAEGTVRLKSPEQEILSDLMHYDMIKDIITLTPTKNAVIMRNQGSQFESTDKVIFYRAQNYATARQILITEDNRKIFADFARVVFTEGGKELLSVHATGNIRILDGGEEIYGDKADYDATTGIAEITGNVGFKRTDGSHITGGKIIYDMRSGTANILPKEGEHRVSGKFMTGGIKR